MHLQEVIRRRRMVRRYDPDRPLADEILVTCLNAAIRAPSAGFSQGWDFVILRTADERDAFWEATREDGPPDPWLAGMRDAPVLVLCLSDPDAYLDRYAEPDKGWTDRDPGRWPIPYWDVDTGMAAMLLLLHGGRRGGRRVVLRRAAAAARCGQGRARHTGRAPHRRCREHGVCRAAPEEPQPAPGPAGPGPGRPLGPLVTSHPQPDPRTPASGQ